MKVCTKGLQLLVLFLSVWTSSASTFTDLGFYNYWINAGMPEQTITAMTAPSSTTLYVGTRWWNGGAARCQVCKWTSTGGWSIVPNTLCESIGSPSYIPTISCLAVSGNYLFIVGYFEYINGNISAQNIARVDLSSGAIAAASSGLTFTGKATAMRTASWGGGSFGSRTYLYLASQGNMVLNGVTCKSVGRTYPGGNPWPTESMHGGVSSSISSSELGIYGLDVDATAFWDSTWGYRHKVYVSGTFNQIGTGLGTSTNVASWLEFYSSSNPWFAAGGAGRGLTWHELVFAVPCEDSANYLMGRVQSQALSGTNAFYVGSFNKIDNYTYFKSINPDPCGGYYPVISIAKMGSGTLSPLPNSSSPMAMFGYDGGSNVDPTTNISASGSDLYFACGSGNSIAPAGSLPAQGSATVAAGWRLNGTTWSAIGGTSTVPNPAPVGFTQVVTGGTAAFFSTTDINYPVSRFVP